MSTPEPLPDRAPADCEVAIVGLGPVGATLAGLLAERGISVIALDAAVEPPSYPRAIAADDEMLRTVLRLPRMNEPMRLFDAEPRVEVRDAKRHLLTAVSFDDRQLGVPGLSFFHQPALERQLRQALIGLSDVSLRLGVRVTRVTDLAGGVRLGLDTGEVLTAGWVVGCDGAGSLVRRQRAIAYTGRSFDEPWVVIDVDTAPIRHLPNFTYLLDRARPSVNMPRPGGHRFEFMVRAGEDPASMADPAQVARWLEPYLAPLEPAGRRELRVVRAAVYTFHARTAERWRDGRVLLAGDAAHCMPPFGGQGLGAGIGDALSLGWRLAEVCRRLAPPSLLDDYERERRPRIADMTRVAITAGRLLTARTPLGAFAARRFLRTVDATPVIGSRFRAGSLRTRPRLAVPAAERRLAGGRPLPNPRVRTADGRLLRLDDVLPAGWALLGRNRDPWTGLPDALLEALRERSGAALSVIAPGGPATAGDGPAVEDLDGSLLALWGRRADPSVVALVRPNRFLAAVGHPAALADIFFRLTHGRPARAGRSAKR